MEYICPALRIVFVLIITFLWSILTVLFAKWVGIDIRNLKQRTRPMFLMIATVANLFLIGIIGAILKYLDKKSIFILGFRLQQMDLYFSMAVFIATFALAIGFIWILPEGSPLPEM